MQKGETGQAVKVHMRSTFSQARSSLLPGLYSEIGSIHPDRKRTLPNLVGWRLCLLDCQMSSLILLEVSSHTNRRTLPTQGGWGWDRAYIGGTSLSQMA